MEVTITRTANTLTATLDGEIDAGNGHELTAAIGPELPDGVDAVIIDMTRLGFIDSSGVSRLVELQQHVTAAGAAFRLVSLPPNVRRVFEITGLLELFGVEQ